ncbi:MAG: redox-sensing transcriptional repressor [Actinomycetota bacterium]|nr:redox-sensing transcriptional repressor [Actinomycetota bacterium]
MRANNPERQSRGSGVPVPKRRRAAARGSAQHEGAPRGIPEASIARLPLYLRALVAMADRGITTVSSEELAGASGVNSAKLRKDLSHLGSYGTRGVGYEVAYLVYQISRELGLTQDWAVAIIGIGNLGRALANYGGFATRGFRTACLIDADPSQVGQRVSGLAVRHLDDLEALIAEHRVAIGVIATPAVAAQAVADRLVAAGVRSVLNFAPAVLTVPPGVELRKVDLSTELQILAFHEQRRVSAIAIEAAANAVVPDHVGCAIDAELGPVAPAASGLRV